MFAGNKQAGVQGAATECDTFRKLVLGTIIGGRTSENPKLRIHTIARLVFGQVDRQPGPDHILFFLGVFGRVWCVDRIRPFIRPSGMPLSWCSRDTWKARERRGEGRKGHGVGPFYRFMIFYFLGQHALALGRLIGQRLINYYVF